MLKNIWERDRWGTTDPTGPDLRSVLRDASAGSHDRVLRGRRVGVDRDGDLDRELAGAEHLDGLALADRALRHEVGDRHVATVRVQRRELVQVDHLVLDAERVLEAAQLREAHVQRHLPTLEARRHLVAGLGALGATTGRLALGRLATTHAGLGGLGARGRTEVVHLQRATVAGLRSLFGSLGGSRRDD